MIHKQITVTNNGTYTEPAGLTITDQMNNATGNVTYGDDWNNGVYTLPNWMSFAMPVAPMPDMADDPDVMGAFMQRQDAVVADMNAYVTGRMSELARELNRLKGSGKLGAV